MGFMSFVHDYSFKGKLAFISYGDLFMCSMNTLSYPSTESSYQLVQHLFVHVSLIHT